MITKTPTSADALETVADDHAPNAPHDPSQTVAPRTDAAPAAPSDADPAPEPGPQLPPNIAKRAEIAARYNQRRRDHDGQFMGDHKPPFVEHGEREAEAERQRQADAAAAPQPEPAPEAPAEAGYTLKVRGKDVKVASRDELLRLADVEPHEAADFTDDRLLRLAQKEMAASARLEEARSLRDAPATPAQAPQTPEQPQPEAQSLAELHRIAIEKTQLGTPEEAAEAFEAFYNRREAEAQAKRDAESRWNNEQVSLQNDLRSFAENNKDIAENPTAQDLLYPMASRLMADDLRAIGLTEDQLRPALNNPAAMAEAYRYARLQGLRVRTNAEILSASGAKVREALRMPAQPGPGQHQPAAVTQRIEEKRTLQAQPTRSGHPIQEPAPAMDVEASRKAAIQRRIEAQRAPNVRGVLVG